MSDRPAFAARYLALFEASWPESAPVDEVRFVVLDSETTGLDPRKDRLITIGAVSVIGGEIRLDDTFDALLQVAYNTSAVTVHGITRDYTREGMEEPEALEAFLGYLRDGVIVGHHIGHDVETLNAGYERHFGVHLQNLSLDTMDLTLHIEKDGGFGEAGKIRSYTLDALCTLFGVVPHDRHTASGDAFITARVFQRLLRLARRTGRVTLRALTERFEPDGEDASVSA